MGFPVIKLKVGGRKMLIRCTGLNLKSTFSWIKKRNPGSMSFRRRTENMILSLMKKNLLYRKKLQNIKKKCKLKTQRIKNKLKLKHLL
jgi:hypothetical protein